MALPDRTLIELANTIADRAKALSGYLEKHNLPQPSLAADGPAVDFLEQGDWDIRHIRNELRDAAYELNALAAGNPLYVVERTSYDMHHANAHRLLWAYNIPKNVPEQGSISYAELSKKTGMPEDKLKSLIHFEMLNFIFCEPEPGHVGHSAASLLMTKQLGGDWLEHMSGDCAPAVTNTLEAMRKWPEGATPMETGFQVANKTDKDIFNYWTSESPERFASFGHAMEFITSVTLASVFEFDWKSLGTATVIDLGGSNGHKAIAIAREAPALHCVVQDLEKSVSQAPSPPADVADRVTFEAHDFFTPEKRTDADVIFLARVFHDWPDDDCIRIMSNFVPTMKVGSRMIVNDFVKQIPFEQNATSDRLTHWANIHMLCMGNAKERSLDEWKALVAKGSEGKLKLESVHSALLSFVRI